MEHVTIRLAIGHYLPIGDPLEKASSVFEILVVYLVTTLWRFRITWRHRSRDHSTCDGVISYWWSFGPKSLSLTVSEIFCHKHHVLIDTMLNRYCACAYHVTCTRYVKFKYILQFLTPTLPIHYVSFIGLLSRSSLHLMNWTNWTWRRRSDCLHTDRFWGRFLPGTGLIYMIRYDTIRQKSLTWTRKLCIQLNLAHVARN